MVPFRANIAEVVSIFSTTSITNKSSDSKSKTKTGGIGRSLPPGFIPALRTLYVLSLAQETEDCAHKTLEDETNSELVALNNYNNFIGSKAKN